MSIINKWTDEEIEKLKYLWQIENKKIKEISTILNRSYHSIRGAIKNHKLNNSLTIWEDYEIEILKELYPKNIRQDEIISKLNNKTWIQARNKAHSQLKLKRPIYKPYNAISDYFENITSIEQAYILGFIAADGCIRKNNHGIHIGVEKKDKELLSWIISKICPDYQIKYNENKKTNQNMEIFEISDKKMNIDLQKYNILPQKTFNIQWPNSLLKELEIPFIIGVFDGDGCLSCKNKYDYNKQYRWQWEIYGASPPFLKSIKEKIYHYTNIEINGPKHKINNVYRLALNGPDVYKLDKYISEYDIGLKRKRIKYYWEFHNKVE